MNNEDKFMAEAVTLSQKSLDSNSGGPFGCVIVKNNIIIGRGNNQVTGTNDPTAHAEVVAIREACKNLNSFQLEDCEIYTSCEPCPMCLGAIYWARPKKVYYANSRKDAADIGFDDSLIYDEIKAPIEKRIIPLQHFPTEKALQVFKNWADKNDKKEY